MAETLALIKPDAVMRGLVGRIITRFEEKGFEFVRLRLVQMGPLQAGQLYAKFAGKPFFNDLIDFMTSGPSIAMILVHLCDAGAVATLRKMAGAVDHRVDLDAAQPGTIRGDFAENFRQNVIHASDSTENAQREIRIFFPDYFDAL